MFNFELPLKLQMQEKNSAEKIRLSGNPTVIFIHLLLTGIVILFLGLSYAYIFSLNQERWEDFRLPKIFWVSSVCVILISYLLNNCIKFYKKDRPEKISRYLILSLFFAVAFLGCQYEGWKQMTLGGYTLDDTPSSSYIYILSGLHGLHILAGIIFLIVAIFRIKKNTSDEVKTLLYMSDQIKYTRLRLLAHYWHTIDCLWLFLFLLFLYQHA